jgi:hypothetical protein
VESRDSDASRRARIKRVAIRQAVEAVLTEHRLVALVYPTLRRKPARIGDAQAGSTCQLSAHSGLPALAVPAGFSADAVPVGIDLLGAAFSEPDLLSLGYAIQQTLKLRRPPFSAPALVDGKPPRPRSGTASYGKVALNLTYDQTTSRLTFAVAGDARDVQRVAAVWISAGTPAKPGAARHRLFAPGQDSTGSVTLSAADREDLATGHLMIRFFVRDGPGSAADVPISLKGTSQL